MKERKRERNSGESAGETSRTVEDTARMHCAAANRAETASGVWNGRNGVTLSNDNFIPRGSNTDHGGKCAKNIDITMNAVRDA